MQINFFSSKFPDTHVQCKLRVNYVEKNCFTMKPQWRSVDRFRGVTRGAQTPSAESLWGRRITAVGAEKSPQCHKYFLQYSAFASERPQVRTWGRQTCFLPRAPSNLVTPVERFVRNMNFVPVRKGECCASEWRTDRGMTSVVTLSSIRKLTQMWKNGVEV